MVPEELAKWILEFNIPVIALGDLNQLPPVIGNSFFLKRPDVVLTEIMRQSSESPIPWLAKSILEGRRLERGTIESKIAIMGQRDFDKRLFKESDIIICGTNKTRENLNNYYRNELLKINSADPIVGDKMICRQNNWDAMIGDNIFLINGLVGYITNIDLEFSTAKRLTIDFRPEFLSESFYDLALDREYLRLPFQYRKSYISRMNKFEYGYAITCHLAQGSQYNKVIVVNEPFGDSLFRKQWLYTAVTRAIDQLIILN